MTIFSYLLCQTNVSVLLYSAILNLLILSIKRNLIIWNTDKWYIHFFVYLSGIICCLFPGFHDFKMGINLLFFSIEDCVAVIHSGWITDPALKI